MKKYKNVLYLVDSNIYLYNKDKLIKYKLEKNIIKNGKIANIKNFIKNYKILLLNYKINSNLFGDQIDVIINPSYTKADIEILKNVLENIGYRKINTINEFKLYKLTKNNAYLNYNNEYCILSYINNYKEKTSYLIENNLFNEKQLKEFINKKLLHKDLFIFGLNSSINSFVDSYKGNCYHFNNDETYLLDLLLK